MTPSAAATAPETCPLGNVFAWTLALSRIAAFSRRSVTGRGGGSDALDVAPVLLPFGCSSSTRGGRDRSHGSGTYDESPEARTSVQ